MNFESAAGLDADPAELTLPVRILDERAAELRRKVAMLQEINAAGIEHYVPATPPPQQAPRLVSAATATTAATPPSSFSPPAGTTEAQQRHARLLDSTRHLQRSVHRIRQRHQHSTAPDTATTTPPQHHPAATTATATPPSSSSSVWGPSVRRMVAEALVGDGGGGGGGGGGGVTPAASASPPPLPNPTVAVVAACPSRLAAYEGILEEVPAVSLLRGFQVADTAARGEVLHSTVPLIAHHAPDICLVDVQAGLPVVMAGSAVLPELLAVALPGCACLCVAHGSHTDAQLLMQAGSALILRPPLGAAALQRLFSSVSLKSLRSLRAAPPPPRSPAAAAGSAGGADSAAEAAASTAVLRTPAAAPPRSPSSQALPCPEGGGGVAGGAVAAVDEGARREGGGGGVRQQWPALPEPFPAEDPYAHGHGAYLRAGDGYKQLVEVLRGYEKGADGSPVLKDVAQRLLDLVHHHEVQQRSAMAVLSEELNQLHGELVCSEALKDTLLETLAHRHSDSEPR